MKDQRAKFTERGLITAFVGEDADHDCIKRVLSGSVQLVYISPESLICKPIY